MGEPLIVVRPCAAERPRLASVLDAALAGRPCRTLRSLDGPVKHARLLFAVSLPESGLDDGFSALLAFLRTHPGCLVGCIGGVLIDGAGDLYTKSAGRELVLAANLAGCAFPGRPLIEGTGDLHNFAVQAKNGSCSLDEAYRRAASDLVRRVLDFSPPRQAVPRVLVLHASNHATSNTLALWSRLRQQLEARCRVTEIGLRNGTLEDCSGCPYTMCMHYGERGDCFYGGVMVQEVYPALRDADALVMLCPNYNDARGHASPPDGRWRRSVCATVLCPTAPAVPIPCASTSASGAAAFTAASWSRKSIPPCGTQTHW